MDTARISMTLVPIATLNTLPQTAFADAVRQLFESAPPLAVALFEARPFVSYPELLERAEMLAKRLAFDDKVQTVNAHPRIGASPATVSALSYREQGYDRESALDRAELARTYAELDRLNAAYEERFGFRFVVFVNGRSKAELVEVLRRRLEGTHQDELETALSEIFQIARDRLRKL
jgi:OHCU decarboxylase